MASTWRTAGVLDAVLEALGAKIASNLGISESCLRRWMAVDDVDSGRHEG